MFPAAIDFATAVSGQPGGLISFDAPSAVPALNGEDPHYNREEFNGWLDGEMAVQVALALEGKVLERGVLLVWRTGLHCTLLSSTGNKGPCAAGWSADQTH